MMCEICGIRKAAIKFTQIINTKKKEMHLCNTCAEERGYTDPLASFPKLLGGLILGLIGELPKNQHEHIDLKCSHCQLSWDDFQEKSLLGCGKCYESFSEPLKGLLRKVHGSNKHIGNRPASKRIEGATTELEQLRRELSRAIKGEHYEQAAALRDKIRDIEANIE